jgi:hypothetical protein
VQVAIESIDGVIDPEIDLPLEQPTIEVLVDLDRAQAVGLKPGDIRRRAAVPTYVFGDAVGG